jgi:hypothetical protein
VPERVTTSIGAGGCQQTEEVDVRAGHIRARDRFTPRAVDMLTGAVDMLHRRGNARIVVDLAAIHEVDGPELNAVHLLEHRTSAAGGQMTVLYPSGVDGDDAGHGIPGERPTGRRRRPRA